MHHVNGAVEMSLMWLHANREKQEGCAPTFGNALTVSSCNSLCVTNRNKVMKCREKGCIFPAVHGELCRQHYDDSQAVASVMPCTMFILFKDPSNFKYELWQRHGQ